MSEESSSAAVRPHLPALFAFLVLSLVWLGTEPLSLAEAIVLTRSELPLGDLLLSQYSPLYLGLLHAWSGVSQDILWLRLLGVGLSTAALLLCPRVLRGLAGIHAIRGAMWLLALSPFFIGEVRALAPSQLAFLTVLLTYLCFAEYTRAGQIGWLAGWTAAAMAALMVHGGLYTVVLVQSLAMVLYRQRLRNRQRHWWLAQVPVLLLFATLCGTQFNRFLTHRIAELNTARAAGEQWGSLGTTLPMPWSVIAAGLILLLLISGVVVCRDMRRNPRHGLVLLGFAGPSAVWLGWLPHDFYGLAALPCLVALASMGIRMYPRWTRQLLWLGIAVTYGWSHWRLLG